MSFRNISIDMFADDSGCEATAADAGGGGGGGDHLNANILGSLSQFEESLLDLTLHEMSMNATANGEPEQRRAQEEYESWAGTRLADMSGPAMRSFLLYQAAKESPASDDETAFADNSAAILYETAALSIWTLWKFQSVLPQREQRTVAINRAKIAATLSSAKSGNKLVDLYHEMQRSDGANKSPPKSLSAPEIRSLQHKITLTGSIIEQCGQLPAEWTVLQLGKRFNPARWYQLRHEMYASALPLNMTLFTHVRHELLAGKPLLVTVYPEDEWAEAARPLPSVYQLGYEASKAINNTTSHANLNPTNRPQLDPQLVHFIDRLRSFLGPHCALFLGKARSARAIAHDRTCFRLVDAMCAQLRTDPLRPQQQVLLSLFARGAALFPDQKRFTAQAATRVALSQTQYTAVVRLLREQIAPLRWQVAADDYHVTLLVVDELLDFMYWEMLVPQLQISRVSSLSLLFRLADQYADGLQSDPPKCQPPPRTAASCPNSSSSSPATGGILRVSTTRGLVLSNPECNLADSERRMRLLHSTMCPSWPAHYGRPAANPSEMLADLRGADVYVYAGHGNGLQFVGGRELSETNLHCAAFLWGCESVALKTLGVQGEPVGAHLFLQYAMCPVVVGTLNVVTDVWTDLLTLGVTWLWLRAAAAAENEDEETKAKAAVDAGAFLRQWSAECQKSHYAEVSGLLLAMPKRRELLAVLQQLRCMEALPLRMRMSLVARGIPVGL